MPGGSPGSSESRPPESRGDMSDTGGDRTRLRRYPRLPVWVVEDHQEVSGQRKPPSPDRRDSNPRQPAEA